MAPWGNPWYVVVTRGWFVTPVPVIRSVSGRPECSETSVSRTRTLSLLTAGSVSGMS